MMVRAPRSVSRGLFSTSSSSGLQPPEGVALAAALPARLPAPPARPVARPQPAPRPLETATPQQRRRACVISPAAPPAPALGSRCAVPGTAHPPLAKRRADSPAKICAPASRAPSHYLLSACSSETHMPSVEDLDDASMMYHADWCNPALFSMSQASASSSASDAVRMPSSSASAACPVLPLSTPREEAASGVRISIEEERNLLMEAISGLTVAADAALRRAEAAEAVVRRREADDALEAERLAVSEFQQDPRTVAMRRDLEVRIRESVMAEVRETVRAATAEATVELRAAAEEIRRLRAVAPAHDACARASAQASREAMADLRSVVQELRSLREGETSSEANCEVEEGVGHMVSERHWAGCGLSTRATSGGSSPTQPVDSQALASEGLSSDEPAFTMGRAGFFGAEEPVSLGGSADIFPSAREDGPCRHARSYSCGEAEPLRVRDVVSKLERQREQSAIRPRLNTSASTAAIRNCSALTEVPSSSRRSDPHPMRSSTGLGQMATPPAGGVLTPATSPTGPYSRQLAVLSEEFLHGGHSGPGLL